MKRIRLQRRRLQFVPAWEGPIEGFAHNFARAHAWKTGMGVDDITQEAWLLFHKLCDKYPGVNRPQWFMALFQTGMARMVIDLAERRTRRASFSLSEGRGEVDQQITAFVQRSEAEDMEFLMLLEESPRECRQIMEDMRYGRQRRVLVDTISTDERRRARHTVLATRYREVILGE